MGDENFRMPEDRLQAWRSLPNPSGAVRGLLEHIGAVESELTAAKAEVERLRHVANAYLAEHPADELLEVGENWLLAIGFMRVANGLRIGSQFHGRHHLRYANVFRHDDGQWWANGLGCNVCRTRGDVRRLLNALGVEMLDAAAGQERDE